MKLIHALSLAGSAALLSQSASAAIAVSTTTATPSSNVEVSFTSGGATSGYQWRDNLDGAGDTRDLREVGQSFLAGSSFTIDKFSLVAAGAVQSGASAAAFDINIFESSAGNLLGSSISAQSGTYLSSGGASISGDWITFDLDDIALTAGNYYTVVLSWTNDGVDNQDQVFGAVNTSAYADGSRWQSTDGTNYTRSGTQDMHFIVQSIPEPTSAALWIGIAAVMVVAPSRLRRRAK